MIRNQRGFAHLLLILIMMVVIIGAVFWWRASKTKQAAQSKTTTTTTATTKKVAVKKGEYNWSTMAEGPYRDKISYATSTDLVNWTDSKQILAKHASVPDVIIKDGVLYVYFVDVSKDGQPEQLGLIKSSDKGKTWSKKQIITIEGIDDKVAVDPAPYLLNDGRIRLFFFDIADAREPGKSGKIYSALSDDGINFVLEQGVRLERKTGLFDPDVVWVDGTWYMYVGNSTGQKTIVATSADGMTFTEKGVAYNSGAIPSVLHSGKRFYLFTGGIDIATSANGLKFTKTQNRFESSFGLTADPGVVKLGKNSYLMVYKTKTGAFKPKPPNP